MLQYTTITNPRPSIGLIVHHTDNEREYADDAKTKRTGGPPIIKRSRATCWHHISSRRTSCRTGR